MQLNTFLHNKRNWTILLTAVFLFSTGWILLSRVPPASTTNGSPPPSPREGFSAPDFTLDLLNGGEVTLSELHGQAVMINYWASWCPPCREEMPTLEKVYQEYQDQGLVVVAVNTTYQDNVTEITDFAKEFDLSFPIPLDRTGAVSVRYQLRGLPSTYFVDREGIIRSVVVGGPMNEALIRSKVLEIIEELP